MPGTDVTIQELLTLEDIEEAEHKYKTYYGYPPFRLSTWNPSSYYRGHVLLNQVVLPMQCDFIDYIYSYELKSDVTQPLIEKIAGNGTQKFIITNSGTVSIALVTSILAALNCRRMLIISPTYFTIFYNCHQKQIGVHELHMRHENGTYRLPIEDIRSAMEKIDAVWITSPVYNTGVYLTAIDLEFLKRHILPHKYLIADESFCQNGRELVRVLGGSPNFIGIYDPMKQFLLNGAKFSIITIPSKLESMFTQWSDIVCGSLALSTIQAIQFFLSAKADTLLQKLSEEDEMIQHEVRGILSKYPNTTLDQNVSGHMMMCYLPTVSANHLGTLSQISQFQMKTGISIIPGTRFHFSAQDGFAFRINLARYDPIRFNRAIDKTAAVLSANQ